MHVRQPTREKVKAVVDSIGMTHQQIADELGVSLSAVDKWTGEADFREIPLPCWTLLLLMADEHPTHRLTKRRK